MDRFLTLGEMSALGSICSGSASTLEEAEPVAIDGRGDLAFARGTYSWTVRVGEGEPVSDTGKWLTIGRRQADGTWLLSQDIWNSDQGP